MSPEEFNYAYQAIQNGEIFAVALAHHCIFSGGPAKPSREDYLIQGSIAKEFLNVEINYGTLRYVYFVNEVPISFEGAFGLLTIPIDCYRDYPKCFPEHRAKALDALLDLTSPLVNGP